MNGVARFGRLHQGGDNASRSTDRSTDGTIWDQYRRAYVTVSTTDDWMLSETIVLL
jgi:hypothetical protein